MDGTLVDSLGFWAYLWRFLGKTYYGGEDFHPGLEVEKKVRTMTYENSMRELLKFYPVDVDFETFMKKCDEPIDEYYRGHVYLKPGARALLQSLREKGVKICLATATEPERVRWVMERNQITEFMEFNISCSEVGANKDNPAVYIASMERLGLNANEIAVFEDSYVALETAKKAGFRTVGIYDAGNFNHERLRAAAELFVGPGEGLDVVADRIEGPSEVL